MDLENESTYESSEIISKIFSERTIVHAEIIGFKPCDYLVIKFKDGSSLHLRYDWIHDWDLRNEK